MNMLECVRFKSGVTRMVALCKIVPDLPDGVDLEAIARIGESGQNDEHKRQ